MNVNKKQRKKFSVESVGIHNLEWRLEHNKIIVPWNLAHYCQACNHIWTIRIGI